MSSTDSPPSEQVSVSGEEEDIFNSVCGQTSLPEEGEKKEMKRDSSKTPPLHFESALSRAAKCAQAMRAADKSTDVGVEQAVVELFKKVYQDLPPRLQEQVRANLNAGIFKHAQENYGLPKSKGPGTKELVGWTIDEIVVPIGLGLLMFIISLYFYRW